MKKTLVLCNNLGERFDGIGDYVSKIYSGLDVEILSTIIKPENKIKKIFSMEMTSLVFRAALKILNGQYKSVIVEYPFVEWNPLICISFLFLKNCTIINDVKFYTTIHEFSRANLLRKLVVYFLAAISDCILVTERENYKRLERINRKIKKIEIPSNIEINADLCKKENNLFVYFGLINSSKAFHEMILAWDTFNCSNTYKLIVITASKFDFNKENHKNVELVYNATDNVVKNILERATFSVLPIKPYVDEKNTTFKASCLAGCISIGVFCEEYKKYSFVYHLNSYSKNNFIKSFNECVFLNERERKNLQQQAVMFGNKYRILNIKNNIQEFITRN